MSQAGVFISNNVPSGFVQTLTGNTGGPIGPLAGNINIVGTGPVAVAGAGHTLTISISGVVAETYQADVGTASSIANVIQILGGPNINTSASTNIIDVNLDTSITLPNTNGSGSTGLYSLGTNPFMHNFGTRNAFLGVNAGNLTLTTSTDSTCIGNLAGNALTTSFGLTAVGSQCFPVCAGGFGSNTGIGYAAGFLVTSGDGNTFLGAFTGTGITTGSLNIAIGFESGSQWNIGTENSNICLGNNGDPGDAHIIRIGQQGSAAGEQDTTFIAGIYNVGVSQPAYQIVTVDSDGQIGSSRGTNGQVLIGSSSGAGSPAWANITSSGGTITITNGANTIDLEVTSAGVAWTEVTGASASMAPDHGYIANHGSLVTLTLPTVAALGTIIRVTGKGAGGWTIAQNTGQTIYFGSATTTTGAGGSLSSTLQRDGIELVCITADTEFNVISSIGNITYV